TVAASAASIASVYFYRWLPALTTVSRALQQEHAVTIAPHCPPGAEQLGAAESCDDGADASGNRSPYLRKIGGPRRADRRHVAKLSKAVGNITPLDRLALAGGEGERCAVHSHIYYNGLCNAYHNERG